MSSNPYNNNSDNNDYDGNYNYIDNSNTAGSRNSIGSTGRNRRNPFLEDTDDFDFTENRHSPLKNQVHSNHQQQQQQQFPTAREEKDRLRQRYLEDDDAHLQTGNMDMPPSYSEVAKSYGRNKAPVVSDEKSTTNGGSSNGHRHHRHHREHREHREHGRERGQTSSSSKNKNSSSSSKNKKSSKTKPVIAKNVDTIDKLDVTGLFGGAFHHDGPFDACTPHRNKNNKAAPVLAFPKDGPNTSLAGALPADGGYKNKMNQVFGTQDDDEDEVYYSATSPMTQRGKNGEILRHNTYSGPARTYSPYQQQQVSSSGRNESPLKNKQNQQYPLKQLGVNYSTPSLTSSPSSDTLAAVKNTSSIQNFDTKQRNKVHGPVTQGLGSTTFLDGAPAPVSAFKDEIQHRKNAELKRKKSFSQRLGLRSPHPEYKSAVTSSTAGDLQKTNSDGPMRYGSSVNRSNSTSPVRAFSDQYDKNDEDNYVYSSATGSRINSGNSDTLGERKKESTGNRFLRRVKTLKVGRK